MKKQYSIQELYKNKKESRSGLGDNPLVFYNFFLFNKKKIETWPSMREKNEEMGPIKA